MWDPSDPTRYLESRFHRTVESEANLTGVVTTDTGIMTAAPYKVIDADHWVFEGTGLKNGICSARRACMSDVMAVRPATRPTR